MSYLRCHRQAAGQQACKLPVCRRRRRRRRRNTITTTTKTEKTTSGNIESNTTEINSSFDNDNNKDLEALSSQEEPENRKASVDRYNYCKHDLRQ